MAHVITSGKSPYHLRSKFVLTVLAVFILLLVYGYVTEPTVFDVDLGSQNNIPTNNEITIQQNYQQAIASNELSGCDSLDEARKNNCILTIISRKAVEQDNIILCNDYPDIKSECESYFQTQKAIATGDTSLCNDVTEKDQCYYRAAISSNDKSLCQYITDTRIKTNCENNVRTMIGPEDSLYTCSSDVSCINGFTCWDSRTMENGEQGPQMGDLKCHKNCDTDVDCPAMTPYCRDVEIWNGDVSQNYKFCIDSITD